MNITYKELRIEDIPILTPIMKASFDEDTRMYTTLLEDGPCGYDTGELLKKFLALNNADSRIILCNGKIIGEYTVSEKDAEYTLEMLFIDPNYVSKGIGFIVWKEIEKEYNKAETWLVETPDYSIRNHRFYEKCGFMKFRNVTYSDGAKSFIFMKHKNNI